MTLITDSATPNHGISLLANLTMNGQQDTMHPEHMFQMHCILLAVPK